MSKTKSTIGKPAEDTAPVAFFRLDRQAAALATQLEATRKRVFDGGRFILGPEVEAFERAFAEYCGVGHGVGVSSGTSALALTLRAVGVKSGDEVLVPALSAIPTATAVVEMGAYPVFVDIEISHYSMDPAAASAAVTPRTTAMIPVHLYGHPAKMPELLSVAKRHGLAVVEDVCQAHGAAIDGRRAGTFGHAAAFSFYPTKNLGAYGDGGMVLTDNPKVAERVRRLRHYGQTDRYKCVEPGINSRLDEVQAAWLRVKLQFLEEWNASRQRVAENYSNLLKSLPLALPATADGANHVFHLFVVRSDRRDALKETLSQRGIGTEVHYPIALPLQPGLEGFGQSQEEWPSAVQACREVLSLPCYPELTSAEQQRVAETIRESLHE